MIQISWLWLPLIITAFLFILEYIFEDRDTELGFFGILGAICALFSIPIYIVAGVNWMFDNIVIT